MKRKRYGIYGLMEYHLHLSEAGGGLYADFTGGEISGYGVLPAMYETSDPVVQKLIESNSLYKRGRIELIK